MVLHFQKLFLPAALKSKVICTILTLMLLLPQMSVQTGKAERTGKPEMTGKGPGIL